MKASFLNAEQSLLTVMLQCRTQEEAVRKIRNALHTGGEAFGLQVESLLKEYRNPQSYRYIFDEMRGKPVYVTNYRSGSNEDLDDEALCAGLVELAECGATLCDVVGDFFDPQPDQMARSPRAIQQQMDWIERIHEKGGEVLISSHLSENTSQERVLEIAFEQKRRGADVIKIVNPAQNMEQQLINLQTNWILKETLGAPFLFLSSGVETSIHRRLGMKLGCCMCLCVYEHDALSTFYQPLLQNAKQVRDNMGF